MSSVNKVIDLTDDDPTDHKHDSDVWPLPDYQLDEEDVIQVIIPIQSLLKRFRNSMAILTLCDNTVSGNEIKISGHSATQSHSTKTSSRTSSNKSMNAKRSKYGDSVMQTWNAGVGYGGGFDTGIISTNKQVVTAKKKGNEEDTKLMNAFQGIHFCLSANDGIHSETFQYEVNSSRSLLLRYFDKYLRNDSLLDIAERKGLYNSILDSLQGILADDILYVAFLDPSSVLYHTQYLSSGSHDNSNHQSLSSSSSSSSSALSSTSGGMETYLHHLLSRPVQESSSSSTNKEEEPEIVSLRTCHHWLTHLNQQASTFFKLQRSAGNTVDEEFMVRTV